MDFLTSLVNSMPGAVAQGLIWGIMAIGVYITYRILDFPDLTVDSSFPLGAAVTALMISNGVNPLLTLPASLLAGAAAGIGLLMNRKGTYFVPLQQDDFRAKPTSCVADFAQILPAAEAALAGRQLQPMIF